MVPFQGVCLFILDLTELIGSRGLDISPTLPFDIDATALQEATWGGIGGEQHVTEGTELVNSPGRDKGEKGVFRGLYIYQTSV